MTHEIIPSKISLCIYSCNYSLINRGSGHIKIESKFILNKKSYKI